MYWKKSYLETFFIFFRLLYLERIFQVTTSTAIAVGICPATKDVRIVLKNNKNHSLSFSREEWDMLVSNIPKIKGVDSNYVFGNIDVICLKIGISDAVKFSRGRSQFCKLHWVKL